MPDREKVMEALDCLAHGGGTYDCLRFPCPYGFYGYTDCHKWEIARDSLELLKEQEESSLPTLIKNDKDQNEYLLICGFCKHKIDALFRFCPYCGREIELT